MSTSTLSLAPLSPAQANEIGAWHYPPPYDTYDPADDVQTLADPAAGFLALSRDRELIGYVCFGAEARVRGLSAEPDIEDVGWGLRPDLIGQGESRIVLPWILDQVGRQVEAAQLRVVIASWNARSLAAARRNGFTPAGEHRSDDDVGHYLLLTRPNTFG